jgi:hypothetical protein
MNMVTPKVGAKHELLFNELAYGQALESSGRFIEKKLMLSSSFRCYQIHNCHRHDLGYTLLCYLSLTLTFNKPTLVCCTTKSDISSTTECDQIHNSHCYKFAGK